MTRTTEPTQITQGERIEWTRSFSGYPADEFDLQYRFRGPGTGLDVDATADGSSFDVVLTAADPAFNVVGDYIWQAWLTKIADSTNTFIVASGMIKVLQGFVDGSTEDVETRSANKIALDTINAALLAFATSDVQSYEITTPAGSRSVSRSDKSRLLEMRTMFATLVTNEIARENARNGKPLMNSIRMVMYDA